MTSGAYVDDVRQIFSAFQDFDLRLEQEDRGIRLHLYHAPASAFVDGEMILGIRQHLFSVLRDVLYVHNEILLGERFDLQTSTGITDAVFHTLRHADILRPGMERGVAVCWGGHAISRVEYDYTKEVGYQLGLRGLDICTGCGPGAMKGPMKGATIGHAKQRIRPGRYIGVSEPDIIAAESPNPIVNQLVIMPDMEKRLEAFIRLGHGIIIFPGGVGTAEETLFLLGILTHPSNTERPFPVILTGPRESEAYFRRLHEFIETALGPEFTTRYQIMIDQPAAVAAALKRGIENVLKYRDDSDDAPYFNWALKIDLSFQLPFVATHEAMAELDLRPELPVHELASNLRRAFSGIVAGNVKESGIQAVERHGPFEIRGSRKIMDALDRLLRSFVAEHRMKLPGTVYEPCYRLV
jgi:predicted Rossmann-fold nucleotide-binding protein